MIIFFFNIIRLIKIINKSAKYNRLNVVYIFKNRVIHYIISINPILEPMYIYSSKTFCILIQMINHYQHLSDSFIFTFKSVTVIKINIYNRDISH